MEIKVKLHTITVTDDTTGESYTIRSVRNIHDVVGDIEATENDVALSELQEAVAEACADYPKKAQSHQSV